jgi:hypothetical protein
VERYLTCELPAFSRFVETKIQLRRSEIFIAIGVPNPTSSVGAAYSERAVWQQIMNPTDRRSA